MKSITKGIVAIAALLAALGGAHAATDPVVSGSFADQSSAAGSDARRPAASGAGPSSTSAVVVSPVPEASTYLMMFAGLVAIGLSLSRRRSKR